MLFCIYNNPMFLLIAYHPKLLVNPGTELKILGWWAIEKPVINCLRHSNALYLVSSLTLWKVIHLQYRRPIFKLQTPWP